MSQEDSYRGFYNGSFYANFVDQYFLWEPFLVARLVNIILIKEMLSGPKNTSKLH